MILCAISFICQCFNPLRLIIQSLQHNSTCKLRHLLYKLHNYNQLGKMSPPNSNLNPGNETPPPDHSPSPPPSLHTPEKASPSSPDKRSIPVRMLDSFRRDPNQKVTETGEIIDLKLQHGHEDSYDIESAITNIAKSPLSRKLEARHLQMIAIGGAIGMFFSSLSRYMQSQNGRSNLQQVLDYLWALAKLFRMEDRARFLLHLALLV